jgi:hypothetical protein
MPPPGTDEADAGLRSARATGRKEKFLARVMMSASEGEAAGQPCSGDLSKLGHLQPFCCAQYLG